MTPIELAAAALGLANIVLIVRRSVWNYPFALAMVSLYAVLFWQERLYSDAGLQLFFFAINVYGWWRWRADAAASGDIVVERLGTVQRVAWLAAALIVSLLWGTFMAQTTDAAWPLWDASIAVWSVAAQILMTRRCIENWHGWIAVNLISIPLYAIKGLWVTAGLYALFLAMAVWGLIEWRRVARAANPVLKDVFA